MQQFSSPGDYLRALQARPDLAVISSQMAADALGVSRSAIANRLSAGSLEGVRIGRTRFVLASGPIAEMSRWRDEVATVEAELVRVARTGATTTYAPVMATIGRSTRVPSDRKYIGAVLGDISRRSFSDHGFLLTALVFNQTLDRPSDSFFGLAWDLDPRYGRAASHQSYLGAQLRRIHRHYAAAAASRPQARSTP